MNEIARNADRIILLEKGRVVMEGTPAQIFSEGPRLVQMGLTVPNATLIAGRLRDFGLPIGRDINTNAQLRLALNELKGGRGCA